MVVKAPGAQGGKINRDFVHIADLYPTFANYADVDIEPQKGLLGCSIKPALEGSANGECHSEFGMGYMGWRAYWSGEWKLVFVSEAFGGTGDYALYNLADDPGEVVDLSDQYPEKVEGLARKWREYAASHNIADVPMEEVNGRYDAVASKLLEIYWGQ